MTKVFTDGKRSPQLYIVILNKNYFHRTQSFGFRTQRKGQKGLRLEERNKKKKLKGCNGALKLTSMAINNRENWVKARDGFLELLVEMATLIPYLT